MLARVFAAILQNKLTPAGAPLASPYYDIEEVVRHAHYEMLGCDDPFEGDAFDGISYVCER